MKAHFSFFNKATGIAFVVMFLLQSLTSLKAQDWFGSNWEYRREITISNPGSNALTNFQVLVTLDGTFDFSDTEADASDIRITTDDGTTLVYYWIETWEPGTPLAKIWVRVPNIPVSGTSIFIYYGNPIPDLVELPPAGPFTKKGTPIVPIGDPGNGVSLLAENMVYDDVTGHGWMAFSSFRSGIQGVGLVWSDDPADPNSWYWHGMVATHGVAGSYAPHIMKENGLWYIWYAVKPNIVYRTCATINGTYSAATVVLSPSEPWEATRVDEPCVFKRNDGKWVMAYMGDSGVNVEQIGYATADNFTGPYTKYAGNPCIAFGPPGSYDAGTIADPWVYDFHGTYHIGYAVSETVFSPWQTALATTTDWINFDKVGIILPLYSDGSDNTHRGDVAIIDNEYVFSYTTRIYAGSAFYMAIATQPHWIPVADTLNSANHVFDFYDGFDSTGFDITKWTFKEGSNDPNYVNVDNGLLKLTAANWGIYVLIQGKKSFGMDYIYETRASHTDQGLIYRRAEFGFNDYQIGGYQPNAVRIFDEYSNTNWRRDTRTGAVSSITSMAQTSDANWHTFSIFRESPNLAGFQIDNNAVETTTTNVPTTALHPYLLSFGNFVENELVVDWIRVRKWAGTEPVAVVGDENILSTNWTGTVNNNWDNAGNWSADVPESYSKVIIPAAPSNQPHITAAKSSPIVCNDLTIENGAVVTIGANKALTVKNTITNNAGNTGLVIESDATGTGSLIHNTDGVNGSVKQHLTDDVWHYVSSPISDALTNVFLGIYLKPFVESTYSWGDYFTATNIPLEVMQGYSAWTYNVATPSFGGTINNGAQSIAITRNNLVTNQGYNLVGNPFPSAIDWDAPGWDKSDVDNTIYFWKGVGGPGGSGNYFYYVGAGGEVPGVGLGYADANSSIIPAMQGFFVRATNDGSIEVDNNARVHDDKAYYKSSIENTLPLIRLRTENFASLSDETVIRFYSGATVEHDGDYDAFKLDGYLVPQIYSITPGKSNLAINTYPGYDKGTTIPIGFKSSEEGEYWISLTEFENFEPKTEIYLHDLFTDKKHKLTVNSKYLFESNQNQDPNRFLLIFNVNTGNTNTAKKHIHSFEKSVFIQLPENIDQATVNIFNMMGQKVQSQQISSSDINHIDVKSPAGFYLVTFQSGNEYYAEKVFIK